VLEVHTLLGTEVPGVDTYTVHNKGVNTCMSCMTTARLCEAGGTRSSNVRPLCGSSSAAGHATQGAVADSSSRSSTARHAVRVSASCAAAHGPGSGAGRWSCSHAAQHARAAWLAQLPAEALAVEVCIRPASYARLVRRYPAVPSQDMQGSSEPGARLARHGRTSALRLTGRSAFGGSQTSLMTCI